MLLGLVGGLSLLSVGGARRTMSAYPRFLRSANPSTMAVDTGPVQDPDSAALLDRVARFPQVEQIHAYVSFNAAFLVDDRPDLARPFEALGSLDGRFFDQDRFTPISGRLPNRSRPAEIAINREIARRYRLNVGDRLDIGVFSDEQTQDPDFFERPSPPQLRVSATVVGVGLFVEEVVQDDTDRSPLILFTPALVDKVEAWHTYAWQGLVLRRGDADVPAVKAALVSLTGQEFPQIFRVTSLDTFHAQQAVRPVSIALAVFGTIAGIAALLLVGQAVGRHLQAEREPRAVARALGVTPVSGALASGIGPALAVIAGGALAVAVAIAASPTMPIGTVRQVEVQRGIDLDWTVLGFGGAVFVVSLLAVIAVLAWSEAPSRVMRRSSRQGWGRPSLSARAGRNLPTPVMIGLRLAFERGGRGDAVPVRSIIVGTVGAVAALVAAVTFGTSLTNLAGQPRLFGWNWDVALVAQQGYGNTRPGPTSRILGNDPDIEAWSGAFFGADQIDGHNVPLLGMDTDAKVDPPMREGRSITRDDEIVLGTATLARLHKRVGDSVTSGGGRSLRIVGSATLPAIGVVHGDHTSLGIGGVVAPDQVPGYDRNITGTGEYGPNVLFVRFHPRADIAAVMSRLRGAADEMGAFPGALLVTPVQRPAEIVNADDIGRSPTVLGLAVAVSAMAALVLALTAAVRRRRRDLALLKALGFTRRQLGLTVACQASATVLVGLAVGIPVGVALGRVLWTLFAHQLNVVAAPALPLASIGYVVAITLLLANLLSALPARAARNLSAALVLSTE
ncbi:MAG TPA: ABC transporter permease [Acidimicrobiales bacterium]|nr:ABC transporter permease [Acidimicrobiales bacterium]